MLDYCERGQERHEEFYNKVLNGKLVKYDYRHPNGEPFSCISRSLDECRAKRDAWLFENDFITDVSVEKGRTI